MAKGKNVLALSIGSTSVKLAEFSNASSGLTLEKYGIASLAGATEEMRDMAIMNALKGIMAEQGMSNGDVVVTVAGQSVFSKFVKCLAADPAKLGKMVEFEAIENIPFPLNEVVWDYHVVGESEGEATVMLAAVKNDLVDGLTQSIELAGLEPRVLSMGPVALANAVRASGAVTESVLVVDVGGRSTDLVFLEPDGTFIRSIPVAGNKLGEQMMRDMQLEAEEADALREQFVQGVLAGEQLAAVEGCVQKVLMRLNAELGRSISFYKSQQGGVAPVRVLVTGGAAAIPGLVDSMAAKLKLPVEQFDVLQGVSLGASVDATAAARDAAQLCELVGLAAAQTMAEGVAIDLMPQRILDRRAFEKRQPALLAAAAIFTVGVGVFSFFVNQMNAQTKLHAEGVGQSLASYQSLDKAMDAEEGQIARLAGYKAKLMSRMASRADWAEFLIELDKVSPEGLALLGVTTEKTDKGLDTVSIKGFVYLDRVESESPLQEYFTALKALPSVSDKSEVIASPAKKDFAKEFEIKLILEEPFGV